MTNGMSSANDAPQSLVYSNGAFGLGHGYPRNSAICPNPGCTMVCT